MSREIENYKTLSQTINFLRKRGYVEEFELLPYCLECHLRQVTLGADEFVVDGVIRIKGKRPESDTHLLAITAGSGLKGVLVVKEQGSKLDVVPEMARRLRGANKF